jgi:hypothetical protein
MEQPRNPIELPISFFERRRPSSASLSETPDMQSPDY